MWNVTSSRHSSRLLWGPLAVCQYGALVLTRPAHSQLVSLAGHSGKQLRFCTRRNWVSPEEPECIFEQRVSHENHKSPHKVKGLCGWCWDQSHHYIVSYTLYWFMGAFTSHNHHYVLNLPSVQLTINQQLTSFSAAKYSLDSPLQVGPAVTCSPCVSSDSLRLPPTT